MKKRVRIEQVLGLTLVLAMIASTGFAEKDQERTRERSGSDGAEKKQERTRERSGREGRGGMDQEFQKQIREKRQAHMQEQHEETKAFHETLKDVEDAYAMVSSIKSHRTSQHNENVAFNDGLHAEVVAHVKAKLAESDMPEEKQAEMLSKLEAHHEELKAKGLEMFDKFIAVLDELAAKEDLTKKDVLESMKKLGRRRHGRRGGDGEGDGEGRRKGGRGRERGRDRKGGNDEGGGGDDGDAPTVEL